MAVVMYYTVVENCGYIYYVTSGYKDILSDAVEATVSVTERHIVKNDVWNTNSSIYFLSVSRLFLLLSPIISIILSISWLGLFQALFIT